MGLARSLVLELGPADPACSGVARSLLLGNPLEKSLQVLAERGSDEVAMLASLVVSAPKSSAPLVGRSGGTLAETLLRWTKAKENRRLEQRVHRFRGLVASAVMGAVTAMLASLGPLVSSLNLLEGMAGSSTGTLPFAGACMAAIGSAMLGLYMSGRGLVLNVLVAVGVFAIVTLIASPLATVPAVSLWGVK